MLVAVILNAAVGVVHLWVQTTEMEIQKVKLIITHV